jgi:AcrR family transcriptional regulator
MPKDTFLNLTEEKRNLIEDVALNEFAEHGFDSASINRIVEKADIAKGSFYQYFEDKGDLYKHILTRIGEEKLAYITPALQNPADLDFFSFLEEIYRSGLAFAKDHPQKGRVAFEIYKNQTNPLFKEIYQEAMSSGKLFYESLLDQAISKGTVDPQLEKGFVIHMLIHLQVASFDYYFDSIGTDEMDSGIWTGDVMHTVELMIKFIKKGIQLPTEGVSPHD